MTRGADPFSPFRSSVARELRRLVDSAPRHNAGVLRQHLEAAAAEDAGALLPPGCFLMLLTRSLGGEPSKVLPLAAAVQLLSLSARVFADAALAAKAAGYGTRLVEEWGLALTLNAGDGFFCLGQAALAEATGPNMSTTAALRAAATFDDAALALCEGLRLELAATEGNSADEEEVLRLRYGALTRAAAALAALAAGVGPEAIPSIASFGGYVGMAAATPDASAAAGLVDRALAALDSTGFAIAARQEIEAAARYMVSGTSA